MKIENIKFKAKSIYNGEWVYGDLLQQMYGTYILTGKGENQFDFCPRVDPSTVCQFTGLTDCQGKEIWEGDILEHTQSHARFTVMFDLGAFFIRRNGTENTNIYLFELSEKDKSLQLFEVVGNKFLYRR